MPIGASSAHAPIERLRADRGDRLEVIRRAPGKDFLFGDDENNKPYLCRMRLFIAQGRVFIAEAGGTKDNMLRDKPSVEWTLGSLRVQCNSLLSPVLASRTCNRW